MYADQEAAVRTRLETMDLFQISKGVDIYCYPAYLTYTLSTLCEILDWLKHKVESRLLEEISITSDMQMTPPLMAEIVEQKSLLMKVKEESEKVGLKLHSEN